MLLGSVGGWFQLSIFDSESRIYPQISGDVCTFSLPGHWENHVTMKQTCYKIQNTVTCPSGLIAQTFIKNIKPGRDMYFEKTYPRLFYVSLDIRIEQNISKSWYTYLSRWVLFRYRNIPVWNSQPSMVQILLKQVCLYFLSCLSFHLPHK